MNAPANRLIHETSPYLLQHAHNPVQWYPWGNEALETARKENKPILVSIGYSACHWCHVMERESFEDAETAQLMNASFVNIKIDREERPDLDHIYMDAVQAMTGSGGWPLNVFLTPEGKPFYGGTYFPPRRAHSRPSWQEVLQNVATAFAERRHEIDAQAENLTHHLLQSNGFGLQASTAAADAAQLATITENILKTADREWGGFGRAPKFPQTFTIATLLRFAWAFPKQALAADARETALRSLDKMIDGGIYDQLGGGFARYATDTEWLIPHFEKMLYDNALLLSVLADAFQFTGIRRYREVMEETVAFLERELQSPEGGFYAALDADSEGEEGKYYVWTEAEIRAVLGADADLFCAYYDVHPEGNWEGHTILRVLDPLESFAAKQGLTAEEVAGVLTNCRVRLLEVREKRVKPGLDDKLILGWNALANSGLTRAYAATGNHRFLELALRNIEFLWMNLQAPDGSFYHTWKNGVAKVGAFLDDYALLIQAMQHLYEATWDAVWLERAIALTEHVVARFSEDETGFFFYTPDNQDDVIIRKKEVYDGALPSGNAVMALNLRRLGILANRPEWVERSEQMVRALATAVIKYPGSFGVWAGLLQEMTTGTLEIAVAGPEFISVSREIRTDYLPFKVMMATGEASPWPLLEGKPVGPETQIWLCRNYACQRPVVSVEELRTLINRGNRE